MSESSVFQKTDFSSEILHVISGFFAKSYCMSLMTSTMDAESKAIPILFADSWNTFLCPVKCVLKFAFTKRITLDFRTL